MKTSNSNPRLTATIGKAVADAREQAEVTQEALAKSVGITSLYVSKIETGRSRPSLETLINIAEALGVSLDVLTGRQP